MNITRSCLVKNNTLLVDGRVMYTSASGEATLFLTEVYRKFNIDYPKFFKMDSLSKLALLCAECLLEGKNSDQFPDLGNMSVILYNSASSIDTDIRFRRTMDSIPGPSLFVYTLPNVMIGEICIKYKIYGENYLFVTENFDPDYMVAHSLPVINNPDTEKAIMGYADFTNREALGLFMLLEKDKPGTLFNRDHVTNLFHGKPGMW